MNLALLNPKVWFELACAAVVAGLLWYAYHWAYMNGARDVQASFDAYKAQVTANALQAQAQAANDSTGFQTSLGNLTDAYIKKQRELANAKSAYDGVLSAFEATNSGAAAPNSPAARNPNGTAGLETELLGNCAAALVKLAEEADGLEARIVGLQAYAADIEKIYGVKK